LFTPKELFPCVPNAQESTRESSTSYSEFASAAEEENEEFDRALGASSAPEIDDSGPEDVSPHTCISIMPYFFLEHKLYHYI